MAAALRRTISLNMVKTCLSIVSGLKLLSRAVLAAHKMLATAAQSESDLKLVTAMLDEEMDMQLGTLSVPSLLALGDAVVAKRPVAFFPAGIVLAAAEVGLGSVTHT